LCSIKNRQKMVGGLALWCHKLLTL
jgi:hypothetical protein